MAARITENNQIEFLLSCVRHSNFGQVDFDQVVEECQIISKGAAAKRFSRLIKRYPTGGGGTKPGTPSPSKINSKTPKPATGESSNDNEEEGGTAGQKSGRSGKGSPAKKKSSATAGGGRGGVVVGGVAKKTGSTAASKGRKNKTAAFTTAPPVAATAEDPGSGEDGLWLDGITVKTETYEDDPIGGMYDARLDPAGFFESDA